MYDEQCAHWDIDYVFDSVKLTGSRVIRLGISLPRSHSKFNTEYYGHVPFRLTFVRKNRNFEF